jgi:hypothetical protein
MANVYPNDWGLVFLKQNPFPNTPPRRPEDAVWAGFKGLKEQLDNLFLEALASPRTQVVLGRGEYGSGKTHAAIYTRRADYLNSFKQVQRVKGVDVYYVRTPKEPEKADMVLYRNIIEAIQFRRLRSVIKEIVTINNPQDALEKLQELTGSEALGKGLWLLGFEKARTGQLTLFQEDNVVDPQQKLLESFFFSQITKSDLKRLGLSRDISGAQDRFHVLGCLLQCLIGLEPVNAIETHRRVILWIDEMEDLINYPSRYHKPFMQGLRDLFDRLPDYFTIVMNFTLASPDYVTEIGIVAGQGFLDRITHQIYFKEPNEEEAFEYVKDLLSYYRTEDPEQRGLSAIYPFDKEALCTLIANLHSRTPRDINQRCADVITAAFQQGVITAPGIGIIDKDFVCNVEDRRIGSELV